jgi:hypothetical protein
VLQRVQAHKLVLVGKSEVFKAMLIGPLAETGDIKLEDTNPEDFIEFLK